MFPQMWITYARRRIGDGRGKPPHVLAHYLVLLTFSKNGRIIKLRKFKVGNNADLAKKEEEHEAFVFCGSDGRDFYGRDGMRPDGGMR